MIVGVICEGPTDFPAIVHFLGNALRSDGIDITFNRIHPNADRTRPNGGWGNVLLWLKNNGPHERVQRFLCGGLFGSPPSPIYDALMFQIDSDIIGEPSFQSYALETLGIDVKVSSEPKERGLQVKLGLQAAMNLDELCENDAARHVICAAVETTETWCLAAFDRRPLNAEQYQGNDLITAFMQALERSEGKIPEDMYAHCNKDVKRRERYCERHGRFWGRVARSCPHFTESVRTIQGLA